MADNEQKSAYELDRDKYEIERQKKFQEFQEELKAEREKKEDEEMPEGLNNDNLEDEPNFLAENEKMEKANRVNQLKQVAKERVVQVAKDAAKKAGKEVIKKAGQQVLKSIIIPIIEGIVVFFVAAWPFILVIVVMVLVVTLVLHLGCGNTGWTLVFKPLLSMAGIICE